MGVRDAEFFIPSENTREALEALKALMNNPNADRSGYNSRGSDSFAYMRRVEPSDWDYLKEAMADWRFPVELDDKHNVVGITFRGENSGDEEQMFEVIAPYVESGSYIEFFGRGDGYRWKIHFEEDTIRREDDV